MRGAQAGAVALSVVLATPACAAGELPPGAEPRPAELEARLAAELAARGPGYLPRTRHRRADGSPRWSNRLLLETSPYLRQHAHNPVDWHAWGDAAFETARRLGRPVLLSIGYSTCHWCHVMEEESFESPELAQLLNQRYVAVKVDREERPDVDELYMAAVQMLSGGQGGWPLTVWLSADRRPFYGATYLPPEDGQRGARHGFRTLLERLADLHREQPDQIGASATRLVAALDRALSGDAVGERPGPELFAAALARLRPQFDTRYGGRIGPQKFPSGLPLRLLLRAHTRSGDAAALEAALLTLESMRDGGLRDHVGGGFHRYTTDPRWRVPHFEKMLYDNALLALAYLEAARITGREDLADVAREVLDWAEREMSHPEGGFYSATDADSLSPEGEREEGRFFTWTPAELSAALGPQLAGLVAERYGVSDAGDVDGRSVLRIARPLIELARERELAPPQLEATLAAALAQLRRVRDQRPKPLRDEKVLAAWNGLMISALARAALALGEPQRARRAERAAAFVLDRLRPDGRLRRSWADGRADHPAVLDDHAFLVAGLLDLYEATGRTRWLDAAIEQDALLEREFEDPERGGFFSTSSAAEALLVRARGVYDAALPSGNGVQLGNLARLAQLTGRDAYRARAERALASFARDLALAPEAAAEALLGLDRLRAEARELVIVVPARREEAEPLLAALRQRHLPDAALCIAVEGPDLDAQAERVPLFEGKRAVGGRATGYACRRGVCRLPTGDPVAFAREVDALAPTPWPR